MHTSRCAGAIRRHCRARRANNVRIRFVIERALTEGWQDKQVRKLTLSLPFFKQQRPLPPGCRGKGPGRGVCRQLILLDGQSRRLGPKINSSLRCYRRSTFLVAGNCHRSFLPLILGTVPPTTDNPGPYSYSFSSFELSSPVDFIAYDPLPPDIAFTTPPEIGLRVSQDVRIPAEEGSQEGNIDTQQTTAWRVS